MNRAWLSSFAALLVGMSVTSWGQTAEARNESTLKFEVVSIKPNNGGSITMMGPSPTGFQFINMPLHATIFTAYLSPDLASIATRILGEPDWVKTANYDVVAKLPDAIIEAWKNLTPAQKQEKERPLLRAMLEERCKLTAHVVPSEVTGYALVVRRSGPKLKTADPNVVLPSPVVPLADGGQLHPNMGGTEHRTRFFGATMKSVAEILRRSSGAIIEDRTGLTGRYDFDLPIRDPDAQEAASHGPLTPPGLMEIDVLGLELKPIKVQAENLVIDHIERPTEN